MDNKNRVRAPISAAERKQLKADIANLRATAARKGSTLDTWEERRETEAGKQYFELGCWLYYYNRRIYSEGTETRIDCARRIFIAGITNPGYRFFTAFDFGERQFDTLFEMGDGEEVVAGLRKFINKDRTGNLAATFKGMGWPITASEEGIGRIAGQPQSKSEESTAPSVRI